RRRRAELRQLDPAVAIRSLHHHDVDSDALDPVHAVHPRALDWLLAILLHAQLDEERDCGREVVDHDADVVHSNERHVPALLDWHSSIRVPNKLFGCRNATWEPCAPARGVSSTGVTPALRAFASAPSMSATSKLR